jgi:uncharacterized membrane protein YoaK (UPF0700 family)
MADLGETSQADTAHKHQLTSWVTVILITVASIVLAVAFVMQSIPVAVVGGVLLIAGAVIGVVYRIMDDAF